MKMMIEKRIPSLEEAAIPFVEALDLLFEIRLPIEVDGINFVERTYTKDGVVYKIGQRSADDTLTYEELEQRLTKGVVMLIKYTAAVCAYAAEFGINLGLLSATAEVSANRIIRPS